MFSFKLLWFGEICCRGNDNFYKWGKVEMFQIFQTGLHRLTTIFNRISIISKNVFLSSYSLSLIPSSFLWVLIVYFESLISSLLKYHVLSHFCLPIFGGIFYEFLNFFDFMLNAVNAHCTNFKAFYNVSHHCLVTLFFFPHISFIKTYQLTFFLLFPQF